MSQVDISKSESNDDLQNDIQKDETLFVDRSNEDNVVGESESEIKNDEHKLEMLLDIPLEITVEIGSTEMLIEDILKLNPNSIIELDKFIDEPIDIKVNGKVIAKGELYTVKNNFGIKILQIITPEDRLKILDI